MSGTRTEPEPKLIFLTGAPLSSSLRWEEDVLSAPLQECFADFPEKSTAKLTPSSASPEPVWRSLTLDQKHLPTGFTQPTRAYDSTLLENISINGDSFFASTNFSHELSGGEPNQMNEDELSQYYEHSYAVHEDASFAHTTDPDLGCEHSLSTSFSECSISFETNATPAPKTQHAKTKLSSSLLTDLSRIPNAPFLCSINPQTMTVNLVVGIISMSPPRTIITRRGGRTVELIEMLVGDDTAAGFGINIWLTPTTTTTNQNPSQPPNLETSLAHLRPRDIILALNIALSPYRQTVSGQTLRKDLTTIHLLYRDRIDLADPPGAFSARDLASSEDVDDAQVAKLARVRRWVMDFVGVGLGVGAPKGGKERGRGWAELPPDSP